MYFKGRYEEKPIRSIIISLLILLAVWCFKMGVVNATSYNMTPTGCIAYYNSGNTSRTGTVTAGNYGAYNNMYSCVTSTAAVYYISQYTYTLPNQWTSNAQFGTVSFYTLGQQESLVRIKTGGVNYACEITTGVLVEATGSGTHGQYYNYIVCPNVPINNGRQYEIDINAYSSNSSLSSNTVAPSIISRDFNFTINESNQISNAINNQTDNIINGGTVQSGTTDAPDQSDYDQAHQKENQLLTFTSNSDSGINLSLDGTTGTFIWNTITALLNSHALIMTIVIGALSIGYIKLILGR